ncbi:hypothetical protein KJI95_02770 [Shewanella sp. JM162201]|uniref:Uncharacterized protein n=1 Tax=Shewanella jiangmenensis TaxID=2837387 RepID=A0ABS5V0X4_9GAMM|nr:hypothetical protein [Shewanella jiangmenensis]MBT1443447.1 hypothetical protein [Shewanella jiangmenensis]
MDFSVLDFSALALDAVAAHGTHPPAGSSAPTKPVVTSAHPQHKTSKTSQEQNHYIIIINNLIDDISRVCR